MRWVMRVWMSRWVLNESKFLSTEEVRRLLRVVESRAQTACGPAARRTATQDCMIVGLGLSTGLRVAEIAGLRCGDVFVRDGMSSLLVRRGKGGKTRLVSFNGDLKARLVEFLEWKRRWEEPTESEAPLLRSRRTGKPLTVRALQKVFKRCARDAGLSPRYSIHSLRHTYACHLYKASDWNLRLVQRQLGHTSIATTQVYADVMEPDVRKALQRLYK